MNMQTLVHVFYRLVNWHSCRFITIHIFWFEATDLLSNYRQTGQLSPAGLNGTYILDYSLKLKCYMHIVFAYPYYITAYEEKYRPQFNTVQWN